MKCKDCKREMKKTQGFTPAKGIEAREHQSVYNGERWECGKCGTQYYNPIQRYRN